MKLRKLLSVLALALAVLAIGCKPENVGPKNSGDDPGLSTDHGCTILPCSSSVYELIVPAMGVSNAGELVISNNGSEIVMCARSTSMQGFWSVGVWYGDAKSTMPVDAKGQVDVTQFQMVYLYDQPQDKITLTIPGELVWAETNFSMVIEYRYIDPDFGDAYSTFLWSKNPNASSDFTQLNPSTDFIVKYRPVMCGDGGGNGNCEPWAGGSNPCNPPNPVSLNVVCQTCAMVIPNVDGLNGATLKVDGVEGGVPPFRYLWNTGATTPSIRVNPNVTTTYTVTVTDANGLSGTKTIPVTALMNASCGGSKKVLVCYAPPDKPNSWKEACIDASKVGTYVPNLRYADNGIKGSNKRPSMKIHGSAAKGSAKKLKPLKQGSKAKKVGGSKIAKLGSAHGSVRGSVKGPKAGSHNTHYGSGKTHASQKPGVGSLRGAVGPCGTNGPVNGQSCGNL